MSDREFVYANTQFVEKEGAWESCEGIEPPQQRIVLPTAALYVRGSHRFATRSHLCELAVRYHTTDRVGSSLLLEFRAELTSVEKNSQPYGI